jgi:hypothetical protein
MLKSSLILRFSLIFVIGFLLSCNQKSIATSQTELIIQPTPPLINANTVMNSDDRKYYSPLETCQQIKGSEENSLCNALVKELDLTEQVLTTEFVYASHRIDLNNDGSKEIILWIPNLDLGGTSGYPIIIFSKTANGFQKLFDEGAWTPIIALTSNTKGWRDVAIQIAGGGVEPHYEIFRYNGKSYEFSKTQKNQPKGEIVINKNWKQSVFGPIPNQ